MDDETRYNSLTSLQRASHAQDNARRTVVRPEARPRCNGLLRVQWRALSESHGRARPAEACCVWARTRLTSTIFSLVRW